MERVCVSELEACLFVSELNVCFERLKSYTDNIQM